MLLLLCFLFCLEMKLKRGKKKLEKNKARSSLSFDSLVSCFSLSFSLFPSFPQPSLRPPSRRGSPGWQESKKKRTREGFVVASMSSAAAASIEKDEQLNGAPPKPPSSSSLVLSSADLEAAAQMCEHEWMSHAAGMGEVRKERREEEEGGKGDSEKNRSDANGGETTEATTGAASSPPKPPAFDAAAVAPSLAAAEGAPSVSLGANRAAPWAAGQQQFADENGAAIDDDGASSPLPSTPSSTSSGDDDGERLDLLPEQRGTFRGGTASARLPLTSPAISDGGGLRDEHVEDPWSDDDDESENESSSGGEEGDNERCASGAGNANGLSGSPSAALRSRRGGRKKKLGGGSGAVRRALLPPSRASSSKQKKKKKAAAPPPARSRSLRSPGRHFTVVTTASLPWMTGTSVNPTLRSAYLARALPRSSVTLLLPWLPRSQQACVFPKGISFETPRQQEEHVRDWIRQRTGFDPPGLRITWYHARYCPVMKSIFPFGGEDASFSFFLFFSSLSRLVFPSLTLFFFFLLSSSLSPCTHNRPDPPRRRRRRRRWQSFLLFSLSRLFLLSFQPPRRRDPRGARAPHVVPLGPAMDHGLLEGHRRRTHQLRGLRRCAEGEGCRSGGRSGKQGARRRAL